MLIQELRERKRELGYSYETISELSGVPLGTVQKVLTGATKAPRQKTLDALKNVLFVRAGVGHCLDGRTKKATGSVNACETIEKVTGFADACGATEKATGFVNACGTTEKAADFGDTSGVLVQSAGSVYADEMQQGAASVVRESITYGTSAHAPDEFGLTSGKRQGEYTVDDYRQVPDDLRVELINGRLYIMEAPRVGHQLYSGELFVQLKQYISSHKGKCIPLYAPVDVQLHCDEKTMLQPDVLILCDRSKIQNGIVFGAPDFLVEVVSPSSRRKDYMIKMVEYMKAGVREYWIIDPKDKKVVVYAWEGEDVSTSAYGFRDQIPVAIYNGDCVIDFAQIDDYISAVLEGNAE